MRSALTLPWHVSSVQFAWIITCVKGYELIFLWNKNSCVITIDLIWLTRKKNLGALYYVLEYFSVRANIRINTFVNELTNNCWNINNIWKQSHWPFKSVGSWVIFSFCRLCHFVSSARTTTPQYCWTIHMLPHSCMIDIKRQLLSWRSHQ